MVSPAGSRTRPVTLPASTTSGSPEPSLGCPCRAVWPHELAAAERCEEHPQVVAADGDRIYGAVARLAAVQVAQQSFEVGAHPVAVVGLKGAQIVNAALGLGQDSGAHRPITALPVPEHSVPGHRTWL